MSDSNRQIVLATPGYGTQTAAAGRGIWRACRDMTDVEVVHLSSSLLAANFNGSWCHALNRAASGEGVDYFAMLHSDIGPDDLWLDTLIDELEKHDLDVIGVAVPIKDQRGLTSLAVDGYSTWRPKCRLTMREIARLPEVFTSEDVGGPLLLNSGCWVCKFDIEWARKVFFTINDRIVVDKNGKYRAEVESEDWFFSRLLHELGLRIGATNKIGVLHRGEIDFSNRIQWGKDFDDEYGLAESLIPHDFPSDVSGWLDEDEGKELRRIAAGKDVLEIGSYCGRSTICMATAAKSVTCVDYWDGRATAVPGDTFKEFTRNVESYGVQEKISLLHPEGEFPKEAFDLVFIDGDHSEESVKADIEKALVAIRPGGLIAFHDYHSKDDPGVTAAVDKFLASGAELLNKVKTLAVVRPPISVCN